MGNCFLYKRGFGGAIGGSGGGGSIPEVEKTASGKGISILDSMEKPLKGLRLFGNTTQNGTPSPDSPVPMESVGDGGSIGVKVIGKNLIPYPYPDTTKTVNGVTFTDNGDGSITVNGAATGGQATFTVATDLNISGVFCLSGRPIGEVTQSYSLQPKVDNTWSVENYDIGNGGAELTVKSTINVIYIVIMKNRTINNVTFYPQLEIGSTATAYEPYKEPQTMIHQTPNGLPGIHVSEGGNYTDENGWQWICDEVDFAGRKYVQRVYKTVFSDATDWIVTAAGNGTTRFQNNSFVGELVSPSASGIKGDLLCSNFTIGTANDTWNNKTCLSLDKTGLIHIYHGGIEQTATALGAYFASNPTTFIGVLATPIETTLSSEELAQYAALHTYSPSTTIFNDADSYMEVKYMAKGG